MTCGQRYWLYRCFICSVFICVYTTTLGAAILAGVGVGIYESFEEAIKDTIVITRVQEPDMEAHKKYQESMDLYLELIDALTPIFDRK